IGAVHIALGALEIGEHRVPAPAGRAEFGPAIAIPCIAAAVEHRVDRARSAHAAPARLIAAAAVPPGLRDGFILPVERLRSECPEAGAISADAVLGHARFP